jgi:hypothetical protein
MWKNLYFQFPDLFVKDLLLEKMTKGHFGGRILKFNKEMRNIGGKHASQVTFVVMFILEGELFVFCSVEVVRVFT